MNCYPFRRNKEDRQRKDSLIVVRDHTDRDSCLVGALFAAIVHIPQLARLRGTQQC